MLILARRRDEEVLITLPPAGPELDKLAGTTIRVVVVELNRRLCRLGIDAPRPVVVLRNELVAAEGRE